MDTVALHNRPLRLFQGMWASGQALNCNVYWNCDAGCRYCYSRLNRLARGARDELLRQVFLVRDPEALRRKREAFASRLNQQAQSAVQRTPPKLISLVFTGDQYDAYQDALRGARTKLKQAAETIAMVRELEDRDIVALAAVLRNEYQD